MFAHVVAVTPMEATLKSMNRIDHQKSGFNWEKLLLEKELLTIMTFPLPCRLMEVESSLAQAIKMMPRQQTSAFSTGKNKTGFKWEHVLMEKTPLPTTGKPLPCQQMERDLSLVHRILVQDTSTCMMMGPRSRYVLLLMQFCINGLLHFSKKGPSNPIIGSCFF